MKYNSVQLSSFLMRKLAPGRDDRFHRRIERNFFRYWGQKLWGLTGYSYPDHKEVPCRAMTEGKQKNTRAEQLSGDLNEIRNGNLFQCIICISVFVDAGISGIMIAPLFGARTTQ